MASFKASMLVECENAPQRNCHRLVILGSAKVGKTAIVQRFLYNRYDDNYTPTIEDFHRKIYRIRGEPYRLDILDTSGNHPFPAMRRLSFLTGKLFLRNVYCKLSMLSSRIPWIILYKQVARRTWLCHFYKH
jgi:small GTP-binding protein